MKHILSNSFIRYSSVGVLNTLIHWGVFLLMASLLGTTQATANTIGFITAASFSFVANARYTFAISGSLKRYLLFVGFMGGLSFTVGSIMDRLSAPHLATLILFSSISLLLGYLYSRHFIFR